MSDDKQLEEGSVAVQSEDTSSQDAPEEARLNLTVNVKSIGPCRKHVEIIVPQDDIRRLRSDSLDDFADKAEVPGFRIGKVPRSLLEKRFKEELTGEVKQKVLLESLEQMSDENDIDPINQPEIDVDSLDIPDEGDFSYEFNVEVRPEFDVPDYKNFTLDRPAADTTDAEMQAFREEFLESYSTVAPIERAATVGDSVKCDLVFTHGDKKVRESEGTTLRLRPTLRFQDAVIEDFAKLMDGVAVGETRETTTTISLQCPIVEMRGEEVTVAVTVTEVLEHKLPELDKEFLERLQCETEEDLKEYLQSSLSRQVEYQQRQSIREQALEKLAEASDWDLPESLVEQQTENALRREMLEMAQAGFTREQISARENEIRQNAIESTRQALKEHFVLDRIATQEDIECDPQDIEQEIMMMALQTGDSPRKVRARLVKNGMIDNLEAQLRERKAVDFILDNATFNDVDRKPIAENQVTAAAFAICGNMTSSLVDDTSGSAEDADEE
ncbi:MAG: trigger factor [Fuerstiella sp.]